MPNITNEHIVIFLRWIYLIVPEGKVLHRRLCNINALYKLAEMD